MKRMKVLLSLLVPLVLAIPVFAALPPARAMLYVTPPVRAQLAAAWDDARNTRQTERAYCAYYSEVRGQNHEIAMYRIDSIITAVVLDAQPYSILYAGCPASPANVTIHTHPPTTCKTAQHGSNEKITSCKFGGPDAWECFPSDVDQDALDRSNDPFGLIQCDKHALVPYWRDMPSIPLPTRK